MFVYNNLHHNHLVPAFEFFRSDHFINSFFRHASVSSTYPGQSVRKSVGNTFHSVSVSETSQSVETTLQWPIWWLTMVADMEEDMVANMEVYMVADIDINIQFGDGYSPGPAHEAQQ